MKDQTPDLPTDLDVVDDVGGTDADRAFDAELSRLLRSTAAGARGAAPAVDLAVTRERGLRRRRRSRAVRAAAVAAGAAVVVASGVVLRDRTTTTPVLPATGTSLTLLPDAPALSPEDEQRLRSLQVPPPRLTRGENRGYLDGTVDQWAHPVDCADAALWAGLPVPTLPGLDASGYTQVCATSDLEALSDGAFTVAASGERTTLVRFYLPAGTGLDGVTPRTAAEQGVSWTRIEPLTDEQAVQPGDPQDDPAQGTATLTRPRGDAATVHRNGEGETTVHWREQTPDARYSVSAMIAADPPTAVRATLDPHPCDRASTTTLGTSTGGALTAERALQSWLDGDDAEDHPEGVGSQGAARSGWVVVEERETQKTFASGDWRVTVYGGQSWSWMVTGLGCTSS